MAINGSVSDDKKWFYPDKTGFMFDTPPLNVVSGRGSYYSPHVAGSMENLYSGSFVEIPWNRSGGTYSSDREHSVSKYNGWLNWLHKYEPDRRFLAISDTNANLNQFPEVQSPWKFTEYVFKGMGSGYIVIEPPLYDPATLTVINGITNQSADLDKNPELRKEGKLRGAGYEDVYYEPVYYYRCAFNKNATYGDTKDGIYRLGPLRKQYEPDDAKRAKNGDLESGLIVNGKKYPPWTDPEAHQSYMNSFVNTQERCGARRVFKYLKPNRKAISYVDGSNSESVRYSGIRLYRKDILAKCVDIGQHGNIPPYTINMSAPKDYIDPETMYRNTVDVIVTYEAGQAVYATDDGVIEYKGTGNYYNTEVFIKTVSSATMQSAVASGKPDSDEWKYELFSISSSGGKSQPKPINFASKFKTICRGRVPGDISNGDLIHRGCAFFVGNESSGCYCKVKRDLLESGKNPLTHPDDFDGLNIADYETCTGVNDGSDCRYYVQQGPREIIEFMCPDMSNEEFANSIGFNQYIDNTNQEAKSLAYGTLPSMAIVGVAAEAMTPDKIEGRSTSLNGMSVRRKVRYEFKTVNMDGKEIVGKNTGNNDTRDVKGGTGKFAFDGVDTSSIGGVDTDFFYGTNLLSRNRFCSSVMHCYNAKYCNKVYGTLNLSKGEEANTFTGVGSDTNYCRYYNKGCPTTEIPQRAREYDREYVKLINLVLSVFRSSGISGFPGLSEINCGNGVYAAVGNSSQLDSVATAGSSNAKVYFMYDTPSSSPSHKNANVFGFIKQYGMPSDGSSLSDDAYYKMNTSKYPSMSSLPACFGGATETPWLVKLHDDYVSPKKFESYVTNYRRFIGGRMPEYKDYSKMGDEVQCTIEEKDYGMDGSLTSGKGGTNDENDFVTKTSYQYHRIDASGEWIIEDVDDNGDGISIGEDTAEGRRHGRARAGLKPSKSHGAFPIMGEYMNSSFSEENGQIKAKVTSGWCYSNDTRESLSEDTTTQETEDGSAETLENAEPKDDCLPLERDWYYCPNCSPSPYSYSGNVTINSWGEPNINQIFTDFEYQQYGRKCPRCDSALQIGGKMKHFAKCRAEGIVNYFGLPGEIIDTRGFFWKNHTEVSRTFVSEVLSKNGSLLKGVYRRGDSANGKTESAVEKIFAKGENWVSGYMTEETRLKIINQGEGLSLLSLDNTSTNTRASQTPYTPSFMRNNKRVDNSKFCYNDRYMSPYGGTINKSPADGLDFVSANTVKSLRNMVLPIQGYPLYESGVIDYRKDKQAGHKNRFEIVEKDFPGTRKGIDSFILASNDAGNDLNYVQFWDGTLLPGKTVKAYYPTSPVWWYRHDYVGGITRSGGNEPIHFNKHTAIGGTNEFGYGGNLVSMSFHSIQGWLPLDKEVVRAIIEFTPTEFPDCPPIGRAEKGGPLHDKHWHSFTIPQFREAMGKDHDTYDWEILRGIMGWSDDISADGNTGGESLGNGEYVPTNYNGLQFVNGDNVISKYNDEDFGFGTNQSWLSWDGFGSDIIKIATEESIWKKYTFDEFKDIEDSYTYDLDVEVGDPSDENSVQDSFSVMPKPIADGLLNNEGQSIPGMFDLSGLNSSGMFDKNGIEFAEKTINTDWAEGGQVIIQEAAKGATGSNGVTANADTASLGTTYQLDITKLVKSYYDSRVSREFYAQGGFSYEQIYPSTIRDDKSGFIDVLPPINYRHYNSSIGGCWLNSMAFYPKLNSDGSFPQIDEGMEYELDPMGICDLDLCGTIYLDMPNNNNGDYTRNTPEYYKYSPDVLCFHDSNGKPSKGMLDRNLNVVSGDWDRCILASGNESDLYFTLNISGYPTLKEHRMYRNEKGSWNLSNAVCQNKKCFVHQDGVTVAEAAVLSAANKSQYRHYMFSLYNEKCGVCRSDLTSAPGAIYTGGDGIETWEYGQVPKKDCIVNGFIIEIDNTVGKCGFNVYGMSSTDNYWETLLSVDYEPDTGKYIWREFDINNNIVEIKRTTLPTFRGAWKDGYNASGESLSGYHFIAKRCNKIKVVAVPCKYRSDGTALENDGRKTVLSDVLSVGSGNLLNDSKTLFKTNLCNITGCEGGTFEIYNSSSCENVVFSTIINSYNQQERTLGLAEEIPSAIYNNNGYYYRIKMSRYIFTVKKFQVYGLEIDDRVKITDDASSIILPIQTGTVSTPMYDRPTKILRATAISGNASIFNMKDVSHSSRMSPDNLYYYVKRNRNSGKYEAYYGEFSYDTTMNLVYLPYKAKLYGGEVVDSIDNIYTSEEIDERTIPTAIEFKYMTGAGTSIDLDITSKGEGPSYMVEADTITDFVGIKEGRLPSMGSSVYFRKRGGRYSLGWMFTNKERTKYACYTPSFSGRELEKGVSHAAFSKLVGGNDETNNGLSGNDSMMFKGKATGKITVTGLPNCIVSGILYLRAPATKTHTYNFAGQTVSTVERTGGLKKTGFAFKVKVKQRKPDEEGQSLACVGITKPKIVVYLKERSLTDAFEN